MLVDVMENIIARNSMNLFLQLHARLMLSYIERFWVMVVKQKREGREFDLVF
jgi:hypothetical protein